MARSLRQSKILEIISAFEVETQDDLVAKLRQSGLDITQATISRDIKELGLIKILSQESGKYKYSLPVSNDSLVTNKNISQNIFHPFHYYIQQMLTNYISKNILRQLK